MSPDKVLPVRPFEQHFPWSLSASMTSQSPFCQLFSCALSFFVLLIILLCAHIEYVLSIKQLASQDSHNNHHPWPRSRSRPRPPSRLPRPAVSQCPTLKRRPGPPASTHPHVTPTDWLTVCLPVCLAVCLSLSLSLSACLSVCLSLHNFGAHPAPEAREHSEVEVEGPRSQSRSQLAWETLIDFLNRLYVLSKLKKASNWTLPCHAHQIQPSPCHCLFTHVFRIVLLLFWLEFSWQAEVNKCVEDGVLKMTSIGVQKCKNLTKNWNPNTLIVIFSVS